jgi:hypothetical protein
VSGVVLAAGGARIHVAGDTVELPGWEDPAVLVLNAGGARFTGTANITMTAADVVAIAGAHPDTTVVAVHMDAVNHCLDTREVLRAAVERAGVENVVVPEDGERVPVG